MRHLKKELSMENLLFITAMLQWQEFLVEHEFWDKENTKCRYVLDATQQLILPVQIPESPILSQIKFQIIDKENFDIFIPVFSQLYKQYIEANRAPYEINISHRTREKMQTYYTMINQDKGILDEQTFWSLWHSLIQICHELHEMLLDSLGRCRKLQMANSHQLFL